MKHVPSPLRPDVPKLPDNATDAELYAWIEALPPCPGICFANDEEDEAAIDAEIAAEDWISHEVVVEWQAVRRDLGKMSFEEWLTERNA